MGEWVRDGEGRLRRATIPHMGRRLPAYDYGARSIYEITIVLEERRPILGRLVKREVVAEFGHGLDGASAAVGHGLGGDTSAVEWAIEPSAWGEVVLACWRKIVEYWPQVSLIEAQLMPDHFHGILFVKERLPLTRPDEPEGPRNRRKHLGDIVQGFKAGCTIGWRALAAGSAPLGRGPDGTAPAAMAAGVPRWAEGYVDTILFRRGQLATMIAYLRDNPRRLAIKRENPALFKVARNLAIEGVGHFAAIGNHFLLKKPRHFQVQCSRSFFAYRRERLPGGWRICRDAQGSPIVEKTTREFEAKLAAALAAAAQGAVVVSPCISHGEREIARQVFAAGYAVISLQNKGFSPAYKPGGKLFETCAAGNLLMLAPIAWPYQPSEKPMTRRDAQVLNRIAQLISGEGAAFIDYKGAVMADVEGAMREAVAEFGHRRDGAGDSLI